MNAQSVLIAAILLLASVHYAKALPIMVRLGYPNCVACHIAPQGGGLLNPYGHSIDKAQSLAGGEYSPLDTSWSRLLNWNGRITQDVRTVIQQQDVSTTDRPGTQLFRSRFKYRNATELGDGFRFTATVTGENTAVPRPTSAYDPPSTSASLFVNTALLSYRRNSFEISVGRDQLPSGINIPDLSLFVRSRNGMGYYDSPTQLKAFWWSNRFLLNPYAFGPGGNEASGHHESGGGILAEVDVFGKRRSVVGVNVLHGSATLEDRTLVGPYARFGFGRWGFLAEHDMTGRTLKATSTASFRQATSYGQLFWAAREWLIPSLIIERLQVDRPYRTQLDALKLDLSARLTTQVSVSVGPRIQRDELTGRISQSIVFQVALKTAH